MTSDLTHYYWSLLKKRVPLLSPSSLPPFLTSQPFFGTCPKSQTILKFACSEAANKHVKTASLCHSLKIRPSPGQASQVLQPPCGDGSLFQEKRPAPCAPARAQRLLGRASDSHPAPSHASHHLGKVGLWKCGSHLDRSDARSFGNFGVSASPNVNVWQCRGKPPRTDNA